MTDKPRRKEWNHARLVIDDTGKPHDSWNISIDFFGNVQMTDKPRRQGIWNKGRPDAYPVIEVRDTDPADLDELIAAASLAADMLSKMNCPQITDRLRKALEPKQ